MRTAQAFLWLPCTGIHDKILRSTWSLWETFGSCSSGHLLGHANVCHMSSCLATVRMVRFCLGWFGTYFTDIIMNHALVLGMFRRMVKEHGEGLWQEGRTAWWFQFCFFKYVFICFYHWEWNLTWQSEVSPPSLLVLIYFKCPTTKMRSQGCYWEALESARGIGNRGIQKPIYRCGLRAGWVQTDESSGIAPCLRMVLICVDCAFRCGYESIPINTIFGGMNIHLPAILMFTRGTRFWHTAMSVNLWRFFSIAFLLPWS